MTTTDVIHLAAEATELSYKAQSVGNHFDVLPSFSVEHVFDDFWKTTGFYAAAFASTEEVIITIRGSEDRHDIIADADLGISQYRRYRDAVLDYVGANLLGSRVTLAGHSLGGGLAQYLAYDAAREFPHLRDRLAVHTHNALGAVAGIGRLHGGYDPSVFDGVAVRNFRHPGDVVSRIGGQAGGGVLTLSGTKPVSPIEAHSNDHFLPSRSPGALEQALPAPDEAFGLAHSLDQLTPQFARAVAEILDPTQRTAGLRRLMHLLGKMPAHERRSLGAAVSEFIPLRRYWTRFLGGSRDRRAPNLGEV